MQDVIGIGTVHKRRRQWGGVKNWSKLQTDTTKKTADMGEGSVVYGWSLTTPLPNNFAIIWVHST